MEQHTFEELKEKLAAVAQPGNDIKLTYDDIAQLLPLYKKYKHLEGEKVIVMFSGGLDTSFTSHFLQHIIGAEVTTVTVDVGSVTAPANMKEVAARSIELKVSQHLTIDKREKLAELGFEAIQAEAKLGQEGHHPASSLSRVAICDGIVETAKKYGITAVFHGSNGSQNNPYRFHNGLGTVS